MILLVLVRPAPHTHTAGMEIIVANVDKVTFDIEVQLEEQVGAQTLPFPGMDSKSLVALARGCLLFTG